MLIRSLSKLLLSSPGTTKSVAMVTDHLLPFFCYQMSFWIILSPSSPCQTLKDVSEMKG